ncbi:formate dehydrogenase accessory protein FdhE [Mergibacter septicus]|uniref:formate dehydrogenase accessory protein FdhE n=1 Tax=Mergibacter septicus TaxID=221402 RepID=UPI0011793431|nr:formate dehydrogenase accessory protein FdhE [Mergibacter septicus]AWX13630.1 formate dehydrogenase accessory protein FdhE [Mergibacter septicus]
MGIRILPESEIKKTAAGLTSPPLLFANPKILYRRRAERLRQLAQDNPLADYLNFVAKIVDIQQNLLEQQPIPLDQRLQAQHLSSEQLAMQPLSVQNWQRDPIWLTLLRQLLTACQTLNENEIISTTIENLQKTSDKQLETLADQLLTENFTTVASDQAIFIWAALNLYWVQLAQQIPHNARAEDGSRHRCPVCGSAPVASVVQLGTIQGLRYLHCALCETEWNVVRSKCTNCEESAHLDYWSIDNENAAIKAESCGDCGSYLKILYQEKDPHVDAVADDLATIFLDLEMEKQDFARSGINPFIFINE